MTMLWTEVQLALVCVLVFLSCQQSVCFSSSPNPTTTSCQDLNLDASRIQKAVASGHVYQQFDFLSEEQVKFLLQEIETLEKQGKFVASGLSNTAKNAQNFGQSDRSTCVVPWWKDSLTTTNQPHEIASKLQALRTELGNILKRNFSSPNLAHECYYSQSKVGSFLPRHMDERHEETKGSKGWLLPSRRSISWLVYLSDDGWDLEKNGGALTAFPQQHGVTRGSTHDGNLQVGWLIDSKQGPSQPVYLDSWFKMQGSDVPHCILYTVDSKENPEYITKPFESDGIVGMSVADFLQRQASDEGSLFVNQRCASKFALLEDRPAWDRGEIPEASQPLHICPTRGSLVLFDSVAVPHQVEVIKQGTRTALAGWFHEATQEFPDGFYSDE